MARRSAGEPAELTQLKKDLIFDGDRILALDTLVNRHPRAVAIGPFRKIDVQAQVEFARVFGRVCGSGPADHNTGARYDPVLVCSQDPARNADALAKIVGVDDKHALHCVCSNHYVTRVLEAARLSKALPPAN